MTFIGHDPDTGVVFESIMFRERGLEVSYTEKHDRSPNAVLIKTLVVDVSACKAEYEEFIESLGSLLDAGLVLIRNPPESIHARERNERG